MNDVPGSGTLKAVELFFTAVTAAAGSYLPGPVGAATTAASAGGIQLFFDRVTQWRTHKAARVIETAAAQAGLTIEELANEVAQSGLRGELAAKVLIAAQDSGCEERLRALSRSLALGLTAEDAGVSRELAYVRALADLDSPHVQVLSLFNRTWGELGLAEYDTLPPSGLSLAEIEACTDLDVTLHPVMGVLLRHGLLEEIHVATMATSVREDPPDTRIQPTGFGAEMLARMQLIGEADASITPQTPPARPNEGGCLVCGGPLTTKPVPSVNLVGTMSPDGSGRVVYANRPMMPLCDKHLEARMRERLAVGWCEKCQRWGEARRISPCGGPYERYQ